jgi:hypothetical protein
MAKKAKAKKAKAKKSGAKKTGPVRVPLDEVARLFSVIAQDPAATNEFMAAARKREVFLTTNAATKRFVRRFLGKKNMLKKPATKKTAMPTVMAGPADVFSCF